LDNSIGIDLWILSLFKGKEDHQDHKLKGSENSEDDRRKPDGRPKPPRFISILIYES
jgi:hypothetical protein